MKYHLALFAKKVMHTLSIFLQRKCKEYKENNNSFFILLSIYKRAFFFSFQNNLSKDSSYCDV